MFKNISVVEIVIIAIVLIVFFGGKKLPELGKGIGNAIKEFKKASNLAIWAF